MDSLTWTHLALFIGGGNSMLEGDDVGSIFTLNVIRETNFLSNRTETSFGKGGPDA